MNDSIGSIRSRHEQEEKEKTPLDRKIERGHKRIL